MVLQEPKDDVTIEEELRDLLAEGGVAEPDATRLSPLILNKGIFPALPPEHRDNATLSDAQETAATHLASSYKTYRGRMDAALMDFLTILMGWGREYIYSNRRGRSVWKLFSDTVGAFFEALKSQRLDVDFYRALPLLRGHEGESEPEFRQRRKQLVGLLHSRGLIDPAQVISPRSLRGEWQGAREYGILSVDPENLEFWLHSLGRQAIEETLPLWEAEPPDSLGWFALNFSEAVCTWQVAEGQPGSTWDDGREEVEAPYAAFARVLYRAWSGRRDDIRLQQAWFYYSWFAANHLDGPEDEAMRADLRESARELLGRLRQLLAYANQDGTKEAFLDLRPTLDEATEVHFHFDSLWSVTKVLLLALRSLSVPAVNSGLRYWREVHELEDDQPPEPWRWVPDQIAQMFHGYLRNIQADDPLLETFREDFASYCLSRLKTRKDTTREGDDPVTDLDMVEKDPAWRRCYVRAVRELRVNPKGRGHHVLHWLKDHDPDEEVREAARSGYKELRHDTSLPAGVSPRRPIFAAFWWIRQAHLLALGREVHPSKAQRTRRKEIRQTREMEGAQESR